MNFYSVMMFFVAVLFFVLSFLIYKGRTDLIHDYHQTHVKDKAAYGRAFGKALAVFSAAPLISGIISLFGDSYMKLSTAVLIIGMAIGLVCIIIVQKKYNKK